MSGLLRKTGVYLGLIRPPEGTPRPPIDLPWWLVIPVSVLAGAMFGFFNYLTNAHDVRASVATGLFFGAFWGPGFRWLWMRRNVPPQHSQPAAPVKSAPLAVDAETGHQSRGDD